MMQGQPQFLNAGVLGNNSARRFLCPNQNRILQDGKITIHDWKTDGLDNLARSKAGRLAVSDLQTSGFILQENVLTGPLVGDDTPDAKRQFRNRRTWQVLDDQIRLAWHVQVDADNLPGFTVKGSRSGASHANGGPD